MPPKEKYNRQNILNAAFELVRADGFDQLSARNIAKRLGCSTQPIYSSFSSIEELEDVLTARVREFAQQEILKIEDSESSFLAIGLGYYTFAQNEPHLFHGLFINGGWQWNFTPEDPFLKPLLEKMKRDRALAKLPETQLIELFNDMFVFTHGLAAQARLSGESAPIDYVRERLKKLGGILIVSATITGKFNIEKLMRRFHEWKE